LSERTTFVSMGVKSHNIAFAKLPSRMLCRSLFITPSTSTTCYYPAMLNSLPTTAAREALEVSWMAYNPSPLKSLHCSPVISIISSMEVIKRVKSNGSR
ncbi:hypothetical protein PENTCL1PPCAC_12444, partial [Pristionchus entomophagus]